MRLRLSKLVVLGVLASALLVTAASAATTVFASGLSTPESITPAASASSGFFVTDADGPIWKLTAEGGTSKLADTTGSVTWRGGLILPATFTGLGGKFLAVGADVKNPPALAYTMDTTTGNLTLYHTSAQAGAWTEAVLAPGFGSLSRDVLVTNQGHPAPAPDDPNQTVVPASVDYFTPGGEVSTLATFSFSAFPSKVQAFGAALANASFGEPGLPSLFVSDSRGNGIYTVDPAGNIKLFTTIPTTATLRQIAFAPQSWKKYGGDLFVSLSAGAIDVVNSHGVVVGQISGDFNARGLLFTTMSGQPTLLFSNTKSNGHNVLKAGPGDVVPQ